MASAMPRTWLPGATSATGCRTTGVSAPVSRAPASVGSASAHSSYSQGAYERSSCQERSSAAPGPSTPDQQSNGPPGQPSHSRMSQGPDFVSAGRTKNSPTPGKAYIRRYDGDTSGFGRTPCT